MIYRIGRSLPETTNSSWPGMPPADGAPATASPRP